ncbi:hypothetical protein [Geoglobus acetivorans]|uniref:Ribbon-helix-helix protein CopG domain-containing protein n=1 Tax=Geoglobus acetivorans TaxID=565033 RepID=A0ABZ3H377_GEOAI|nr:hypothetical protein [Geoglobus acetivorans]
MEKQVRLGTYISKETYNMLRDLTEEYGTQSRVIDVALKLLYEIHRRNLNAKKIITRESLIENFDCVVITRSNLENFIRKEPEKFYEEDFIDAMVRFTLNVDVEKAQIFDLVRVLDDIYVKAAKWFSNIIVDEKNDGYEMTFTHISDLNYSNFFATYFKNFLTRFGYIITGESISSKFFSIAVKA